MEPISSHKLYIKHTAKSKVSLSGDLVMVDYFPISNDM